MNIFYVLIFTTWAGKVFASLIKFSNLSNTKLGNNLCLKTLLYEYQFSIFFCLSYTVLYFMATVRDSTIGNSLLYKHAYVVDLITDFLRYIYKILSYIISFLIFLSGDFNR